MNGVAALLARAGQGESSRRWALIIAVGLAGASWLVQGRLGFGLADEGYLWYGVQRVMAGEVPIRDFMAYDPGRYYFSALLMALPGDNGLLALRGTLAVVQAIGLYLGLRLIARQAGRTSVPYLLLGAVAMFTWMFLSYKLYDITASIGLLAALALMAGNPLPKNFFVAGLAVGLAAVFGRNHGVYGAIGSLGLLVYMALAARKTGALQPVLRGGLYWAAGVLVGFAPVLVMLVLVPGFAGAFADSIRFLFEIGATNLARPVPWPWAMKLTGLPLASALQNLAYGFCFVVLIAFSVGALFWLALRLWQGRPVTAGLAAAACLAPVYAHYAFSRADADHLSLGVFPVLLGLLLALSAARPTIKWPATLLLVVFSVGVTYNRHPVFEACRPDAAGGGCVAMRVGNDEIRVPNQTAQILRVLQRYVAETPPGRGVLIAPFWPGAYPALGKASPIWGIYSIFPRSEAAQMEEVRRLEQARPGLLCISDFPLDGRPELAFSKTHPLIVRHISENYRLVARFGTDYLFRPPELVSKP